MNELDIKNALMSTLFVAGDAVSTAELAASLDVTEKQLGELADEIIAQNERESSGILLKKIGKKLQLCSNPKYVQYIDDTLAPIRKSRLSQALLETLAIIAYKQPITRLEIEQVRGVACNYSLAMLIETGLIERCGHKKTLGNPILYSTSDEFLRHFGISGLDELPTITIAE